MSKCQTEVFQNAALAAAKHRGLRVQVRLNLPEGIYIQAYRVIRKRVVGKPLTEKHERSET